MVLVQKVRHCTSHGSADSKLEYNGKMAHVEKLPLPVIVDTCEECLIDEEVGKCTETH